MGTLLKVSTQQFGSSVFADDCSKECYRVVVVLLLFSPSCFARFCCVELKCTETLTIIRFCLKFFDEILLVVVQHSKSGLIFGKIDLIPQVQSSG